MGYENEFALPVVLDVETVGRNDVADLLGEVKVSRAIKDMAKIEAARVEKTNDLIARAGLEPDLCRIVALGLQLPNGEIHVHACRDTSDETHALAEFWKRVITPQGGVRPIITYNGHSFDLIVVQRRSLLLKLRYPEINLKKFNNPNPDLMWIMSKEGRLTFRSLEFYQRLLELPCDPNPLLDDDPVNGGDIAGLVADGGTVAWAKICAHCKRDIELTAALARRIDVLPEYSASVSQHGLF